jgi:hypothetical protein
VLLLGYFCVFLDGFGGMAELFVNNFVIIFYSLSWSQVYYNVRVFMMIDEKLIPCTWTWCSTFPLRTKTTSTLSHFEPHVAKRVQVIGGPHCNVSPNFVGLHVNAKGLSPRERWRFPLESLDDIEVVQQGKQAFSFKKSPLLCNGKDFIYYQAVAAKFLVQEER